VLPRALPHGVGVPHVLPDEQLQRPELVLLHHLAGPRESLLPHAVEVDPPLPIGPRRAVHAPGLVLVFPGEKRMMGHLAVPPPWPFVGRLSAPAEYGPARKGAM